MFTGFAKLREGIEAFHWAAFAAACGLAFGNYVLRFSSGSLPWRSSGFRGVRRSTASSPSSRASCYRVSGKVGEVFKSLVLFETYDVPVAETGAHRRRRAHHGPHRHHPPHRAGLAGFHGGLFIAGLGTALVGSLLVNHRLALAVDAASFGLVSTMPGRSSRIGPKLEAGLREPHDSW